MKCAEAVAKPQIALQDKVRAEEKRSIHGSR